MARPSTLDLAVQSCAAATERWNVRLVEICELERQRAKLQRHNFKGAEMSRIYSDWLSSIVSAHDELSGSLRDLRSRARELMRNNPYAGGYIDDLATAVIGPHGFRMRARVRRGAELAKDVNTRIETAWREWYEGPVTADGRLSGAEFEELAFQTMVGEGECFIRKIVSPEFPHGLALQIVDADLVDESYSMVMGGARQNEVYMGVEVDALGRRVAYHVLDYSQYGPGYQGRGRLSIGADQVLHLYRPRRPNQMRGYTWLARVMAALHDLMRYHQHELVASGAGAAKMGFILNENGPVGGMGSDPVTEGTAAQTTNNAAGGRVSVEAEPGTIWELERGQKFEPWDPNHPAQAFGDFTKSVVHSIAAGSPGATYESMSSDYSDVTYLSERAARIRQRSIVQRLQQVWVRMYHRSIDAWWLQTAMLTGALKVPGGDWRVYRDRLWIPCGQEWVDPAKDGSAAEQLLKLNLTTHARLAAARGDDFEEILEERKRERELAAEYGVDLSLTPPAAPATSAPPTKTGREPDDDDTPYDADARKAAQNGNGKRGRSTNRVAAGAQ